MENISELLAELTGVLESQVRTQMTNNWPATPTAILYSNEKAYEAQKEIMTTLQRVWRGRAEAVCQLVIRDGKYCLPLENGQWESLTTEQVQEHLDEMFAHEHSFRTMNELLLVQIQNTAGYTSLEQFENGYLYVDNLKSLMGMSACKSMKIILLDESGRGRVLANQIRAYLRETMSSKEVVSSATAILSNRLKNGIILMGQRIRENYALAGDLILLANNSSNNRQAFSPKYSRMFPISTPHFITASYTYASKPHRAICETLLNATLTWLEKRFGRGDLLSVDLISKKLEITGGVMKLADCFFQQYVNEKLPPQKTLEYLPRVGTNQGVIGGLPFKEYDRVTLGAFQKFYENSVLCEFGHEQLKWQFRDYFAARIRGTFSPREAARSLTAQTVEQVLMQLQTKAPSEMLTAAEYLDAKSKQDFYKIIIPICEEVLLEIGASARAYIKQISDISEEFQHSFMLDIDTTVQEYYHELATEKLEGGLGEQLLEAFNRQDLPKAEMLDELGQLINRIFASHTIFSLPLQEELTTRMGGNANQVQAIIQQELTDGLGDSIRLQTAIVPEIMFETILVNKCDANGNEGLFYTYLSNSFNNAECLDTGNSNAVEFVQLYAVDTHTL